MFNALMVIEWISIIYQGICYIGLIFSDNRKILDNMIEHML